MIPVPLRLVMADGAAAQTYEMRPCQDQCSIRLCRADHNAGAEAPPPHGRSEVACESDNRICRRVARTLPPR